MVIRAAQAEEDADVPGALPAEGVLYDPKADYDQGVFTAEEEIQSGVMSIWIITTTNRPAATDPDTGLPVKHILVAADEPWHKQCMEHRVRGHNDTIRRHLGLSSREADPPSTNNAGTDPGSSVEP